MRTAAIAVGEEYAVEIRPYGVQRGTVRAISLCDRPVVVAVEVDALGDTKWKVNPGAVRELWLTHEAKLALALARRQAQRDLDRAEMEDSRKQLGWAVSVLRAAGATLTADELTKGAASHTMPAYGHRLSVTALREITMLLVDCDRSNWEATAQ